MLNIRNKFFYKIKAVIFLLIYSLFTLNSLSLFAYALDSPDLNNCNFKLIQEKSIDGVPILLYEHKGTGAKFIIEKDNTPNLSIEFLFRTPTENDKGTMHVLEHCIMNGSKNYPIKDIMFAINKKYPMSNIDATTYHDFTTYKISSLSEDELNIIYGILLDCIFNPLILTDERIFFKEALRYDLADKEELNGVVYNEILYAYNDQQKSMSHDIMKNLFHNTNQQFDSGGVPLKLVDLSYNEVVDAYKKFYTPQNMLVVIHGNFNYNKVFSVIDEQILSHFSLDSNSLYKVSNDSQPENTIKHFESYYKSDSIETSDKYFTSSYILNSNSIKDFTCASLFSSLCNANFCKFKDIVRAKNYDDISVSLSGGSKKVLSFKCLKRSNEPLSHVQFQCDLIDILETYLTKLNANCNFNLVKDNIRSNTLKKNSNSNEKIKSITFFHNFTYYDNPLKDIELYSSKSLGICLDEVCNFSYIKSFLHSNIFHNSNYSIGVFHPKKINDKLKTSLLPDKVKERIFFQYKLEKQNDFETWLTREDNLDCLPCIPLIKLKHVINNRVDIKQEYFDNIKFASSNICKGETLYFGLYFDLSEFNGNDLNILNLILDVWWNRFKGFIKVNREIGLSESNNRFLPYLKISCNCTLDDIESFFNLLHKLLDGNKLIKSDIKKGDVKDTLINLKQKYFCNNYGQIINLQSSISKRNKLTYYSDSMEYINYLENIINDKIQLENINSNVDYIVPRLFSKDNLYGAYCIGCNAAIHKFKSFLMNTLKDNVEHKNIKIKNSINSFFADDKDSDTYKTIITPDSSMCAFDFSLCKNDSKYVINNILNYEYLLPLARTKGGAYSAINFIDNNNIFVMLSSADSNPQKTIEILKKAPEFLLNWECNDQTLHSYKILTAKQFTKAHEGIAGTLLEIDSNINEFDYYSRYTKILQQISNTTKDDIKKIAYEMYISMNKT